MVVACAICDAIVDAEEVAHLQWVSTDDPLDSCLFTLLKCPKCEWAILVRQDASYAEREKWNETKQKHESILEQYWQEPTRVFPDPERQADHRLPKALRECFQEVLGCFRAKQYQATALMCRRTLEGLCKLQGAEGGLASGLKQLHEKQLIDNRLFEWAEALRQDGNLAAHDFDVRVAREDAAHIVAFTEAILEYVFVLTQQFQEYQNLRAKRSSTRAQKKPDGR